MPDLRTHPPERSRGLAARLGSPPPAVRVLLGGWAIRGMGGRGLRGAWWCGAGGGGVGGGIPHHRQADGGTASNRGPRSPPRQGKHARARSPSKRLRMRERGRLQLDDMGGGGFRLGEVNPPPRLQRGYTPSPPQQKANSSGRVVSRCVNKPTHPVTEEHAQFGAGPSQRRRRKTPAQRQQKRTFTAALSAAWPRHGHDAIPQKRY